MSMRQFFISFIFLVPGCLAAQNFAGKWVGTLTQDGKSDQYIYEIQLEQHESRVSGVAFSEKASGGVKAKFEIGGAWDGVKLTLQEVRQFEPEGAKWCLKHIRLSLIGQNELKGSWEAEGCKPGWIVLRRADASGETNGTTEEEYSTEGNDEIGFADDLVSDLSLSPEESLPGHWVGYLDQSDREYGFYFEMDINADGTGVSRIISDGEGGNATHLFEWSFDAKFNRFTFVENRVQDKSVESWPWCIKSGKLFFKQEPNRLALRGRWEGHIEGHPDSKGACAPGKLYLERPLFRPQIISQKTDEPEVAQPEKDVKKYEVKEERKVKVDRVLEVKSKRVRVAVWDNGTVDGDILSLFVNGEMILENYRVSRRKHITIVELDQPTNYLILHAINLGSITPNTVAVSVDDGIEEQVVIMSSNLAESGAIMLREFRVGN